MRLNLISVNSLDDEGFRSTFENDKWKLTKGSLVVARGQKHLRLYMMQAKLSNQVIHVFKQLHASVERQTGKKLKCIRIDNGGEYIGLFDAYCQEHEHNNHPRFKARLVVKGFNQKKGIDFDEIFSPVMKMTSIRTVLGLAASLNLEVEQMDVKTAFLHGDLISNLKKQLDKSFVTKDLGSAKQILGMQIIRDRNAKKLWLSQEKYIDKVLQRFKLDKVKAISCPLANHFKLSFRDCPSTNEEKEEMSRVPYASAVGSLMYVMVCTRPDIAHAVGVKRSILMKMNQACSPRFYQKRSSSIVDQHTEAKTSTIVCISFLLFQFDEGKLQEFQGIYTTLQENSFEARTFTNLSQRKRVNSKA
ncbi:hypothetical protein K2173_020689 [Erythroxylum novogranatense]|uniref:Reverse transcriptase Ty1/copia-type domain-containing protein n=1 Tax=Erythroxylum novogranatense TaxID=1862640 RepID=A0AAV8TNU6_9ROSI|nr:hypothetical protein K2173_020689 [Erythroxylum novogranatense]